MSGERTAKDVLVILALGFVGSLAANVVIELWRNRETRLLAEKRAPVAPGASTV